MEFPNEIKMVFKGGVNQSLWGYQNPAFDGSTLQVTLDAIVMEESLVPFRFEAGEDRWSNDKGSHDSCMTYVFKLGGEYSPELQDLQMQLIGAFTHALPHDWKQYHAAYRAVQDYTTKKIHCFVYRVYRNSDDARRCQGHPEMLCGVPMGMHHCNVCGEMVVAGVPHPSPEHFEELDAEMLADMERQKAEQAAWFEKVWGSVESEYAAYGKIEVGTDDDPTPPDADSLKLAREFFEYVRENITVHSRERVVAIYDHEGYVGLVFPKEPKSPEWWSCTFYADETVTYWRNADGSDSKFVKVPQGPNHNRELLDLIHQL